MKKLIHGLMCLMSLVFCFDVCRAQEREPAPTGKATFGDNWNFLSPGYDASIPLKAGATFKQTIRAKGGGSLSLLWLYMGNNQTPYSARLVIKLNDVQVFDKTFDGLEQTFYAVNYAPAYTAPTVFPLEGVGQEVKTGDKIELQITPRQDVGMMVIYQLDQFSKARDSGGDWSFSEVPGYGKVALRFRLW